MTESEMFAFGEIVRDLRRVFRSAWTTTSCEHGLGACFMRCAGSVFRKLRRGAEAWLQRGSKLPKPAEWIDAIPRQSEAAQADLPVLSASQAAEYLEGRTGALSRPAVCVSGMPACGCHGQAAAVRAGIQRGRHRPQGQVRRADRDGWALGARRGTRARWYQAKSDFYEAYYAALAKKTMPKSGRRQMPALPEAS